MSTRRLPAITALLGTTALSALPLPAQGPFVNFEEPQVEPIAVATVGSGPSAVRFLLVCNTPDNSVEIYRTTAPFDFLARVPVGLAPVTVRVTVDLDATRFYTCNFLGDSVTAVRLATSGGGVACTVERTTFVGDEPSDIAFFTNGMAFVSLHSRSGVAVVNKADLSAVATLVRLEAPSPYSATVQWAVKAPRTMAVLPDQRFYALNTRGGMGPFYDLDLYVSDPNNPPVGQNTNLHMVGGLGTTNFNFAIDSIGRRMVVVGGRAQNLVQGVVQVSSQPTGFVQSWLTVLDLVPGAAGGPPAVIPEQVAGSGTKPLFRSINLNRDYSNGQQLAAVPPANALSQPTDVLLIEDAPGNIVRVVVAAFGSDKVAVLAPDANQPSGWLVQQVPIPLADATLGYGASGPRGLAWDPDGIDPWSETPPGLVYVCNRLDNSFAVINPWGPTPYVVAQRSLRNDPTPVAIRKGRPFLYSAHLTSGSRTVACSSCHIDGDNDSMVWNLGSTNSGPPIAAWLHDGDNLASMTQFPPAKGLMTTQSLRGLVNSHLEPAEMQFVTTNAPYHWRGDKSRFQDFNEAFVNLQGMPDLGLANGPHGLTEQQMDDYTAFINTIHHPPNPEQWKDRTLKGVLGNPDALFGSNGLPDGSGGLYGLKVFHTAGVLEGRSCAHCHELPDGSRNTLVLQEPVQGFLGLPTMNHPFEAAATRHLFGREMAFTTGFGRTDNNAWIQTGTFGLLHEGGVVSQQAARSINDFIHRVFVFPTVNGIADTALPAAVTEFVRQFDTGVAPIIGTAWTVDPQNPVANTQAFDLLESQAAEGNAGVAVYTRVVSGTNVLVRGFWFDVAANTYREESGLGTQSRSALIALAGTGNAVIAQATPTGSERRVASLSGVPAVLQGPPPSNLELRPMVPNTFWLPVPRFTANWDPTHPTNPFLWQGPGPQPLSMLSVRTLQQALAGLYGVPGLRHEGPRRLRVVGDDIRHGAKLVIGMPTQDPSNWPVPVQQIRFDLTPTGYTWEGRVVWETAEELDAMQTLAWLCGGYWADGVLSVLQLIAPSLPLNPTVWNRYQVKVENENGTVGVATAWQSLSIADVR